MFRIPWIPHKSTTNNETTTMKTFNMFDRKFIAAIHMPQFIRAAGLALILPLGPGSVAHAQPFAALPDAIPALIPFDHVMVELNSVATGFASPVTAAVAPEHDDTLFVGDQTGQIWAVDVKHGGRAMFADLSGRLIAIGIPAAGYYDERGLLGLAFHPQFTKNGLFYTYTSERVTQVADFSTMPAGITPNCQNVLAEWRVMNPKADPLVFDPGSRREVLRVDKPQLNHNGGSIQFGKDRLLYLSLGDGGAADDLAIGHVPGGNAQSLTAGNILGKIIRIDPLGRNSANHQYGIPRDNPPLSLQAPREIYAYGFRNPWRTSFDRETGRFFVGDVGQNDIEEVDVVEGGRNYGWPVKEGEFLFANRTLTAPPRGPAEGAAYQFSPGVPFGLTDPIAEYDHADAPGINTEVRVAVVGGYVSRGHSLRGLRGHYVFGDYSGAIGTPVAGHLYFLDKGNEIRELVVPSRIGADGKTHLGLAVLGFGEDAKGDLYLLANRSGTLADPNLTTFPGTSGEVFKLVPVENAKHYRQTNLVSDVPDVALLTDPDLVNAWGIAFSPSSPFWINDNGTGMSTIYAVTDDAQGMVQVVKQGLVVTIPGEGTPTGQLFDASGSFHGDIFISATEDGIISGWRNPLGTAAEVLVNRPTAIYKGVTRATTTAHGPVLLAANFSEGFIDSYGANLALIAQYRDDSAPAGYAPFNVQNLGGTIYVTFAKQDDQHHDDVGGPGHGLIDTFDPETGTFTRLATGKDAGGKLREIDSPWGLALAPVTFGKHAGELLVGNFGSGTVMTFDPMDGKFHGLLESCEKHQPVMIDGLWGLSFGNGAKAGHPGTLYFTAGPGGEGHGLFGSLDPDPDCDDD